jgi:hypothetical protein
LAVNKIKLKPLKKTIIKHIILSIIFLIGGVNEIFSQSLINAGIKLGGSKLLGEYPAGGPGMINEFDNKTGFAYALEISKYLSDRWEIGIDFTTSNLKGDTYDPDFSAEGIQAGIPSQIIDPVEYENKLFGQNIYFRYFFKPVDSEGLFMPFVKAGGGYINYTSKFKYIDAADDDLLFGKGKEGYTDLSTPVFLLGTGFKTTISPNLYILGTLDLNLVNYDFLDVIHNYSDDNKRHQITGVFTEFKIGIFYSLTNPNAKEKKEKKTKGKNKVGNSSKSSHLPFAPGNKSK